MKAVSRFLRSQQQQQQQTPIDCLHPVGFAEAVDAIKALDNAIETALRTHGVQSKMMLKIDAKKKKRPPPPTPEEEEKEPPRKKQQTTQEDFLPHTATETTSFQNVVENYWQELEDEPMPEPVQVSVLESQPDEIFAIVFKYIANARDFAHLFNTSSYLRSYLNDAEFLKSIFVKLTEQDKSEETLNLIEQLKELSQRSQRNRPSYKRFLPALSSPFWLQILHAITCESCKAVFLRYLHKVPKERYVIHHGSALVRILIDYVVPFEKELETPLSYLGFRVTDVVEFLPEVALITELMNVNLQAHGYYLNGLPFTLEKLVLGGTGPVLQLPEQFPDHLLELNMKVSEIRCDIPPIQPNLKKLIIGVQSGERPTVRFDTKRRSFDLVELTLWRCKAPQIEDSSLFKNLMKSLKEISLMDVPTRSELKFSKKHVWQIETFTIQNAHSLVKVTNLPRKPLKLLELSGCFVFPMIDDYFSMPQSFEDIVGLDLSAVGLLEVPVGFLELKHLDVLNISKNPIASFPVWLQDVKVTEFNASDTNIFIDSYIPRTATTVILNSTLVRRVPLRKYDRLELGGSTSLDPQFFIDIINHIHNKDILSFGASLTLRCIEFRESDYPEGLKSLNFQNLEVHPRDIIHGDIKQIHLQIEGLKKIKLRFGNRQNVQIESRSLEEITIKRGLNGSRQDVFRVSCPNLRTITEGKRMRETEIKKRLIFEGCQFDQIQPGMKMKFKEIRFENVKFLNNWPFRTVTQIALNSTVIPKVSFVNCDLRTDPPIHVENTLGWQATWPGKAYRSSAQHLDFSGSLPAKRFELRFGSDCLITRFLTVHKVDLNLSRNDLTDVAIYATTVPEHSFHGKVCDIFAFAMTIDVSDNPAYDNLDGLFKYILMNTGERQYGPNNVRINIANTAVTRLPEKFFDLSNGVHVHLDFVVTRKQLRLISHNDNRIRPWMAEQFDNSVPRSKVENLEDELLLLPPAVGVSRE